VLQRLLFCGVTGLLAGRRVVCRFSDGEPH
jgi:hypothetical protein